MATEQGSCSGISRGQTIDNILHGITQISSGIDIVKQTITVFVHIVTPYNVSVCRRPKIDRVFNRSEWNCFVARHRQFETRHVWNEVTRICPRVCARWVGQQGPLCDYRASTRRPSQGVGQWLGRKAEASEWTVYAFISEYCVFRTHCELCTYFCVIIYFVLQNN